MSNKSSSVDEMRFKLQELKTNLKKATHTINIRKIIKTVPEIIEESFQVIDLAINLIEKLEDRIEELEKKDDYINDDHMSVSGGIRTPGKW